MQQTFLNVDFHFFEDLIPWEGRIQCHWGSLLHFLLWRLSVWCASMCTPFLQMSSDLPLVALGDRSSLHSRDSTQICYGQSHWQLLYSTQKAYTSYTSVTLSTFTWYFVLCMNVCVHLLTHSFTEVRFPGLYTTILLNLPVLILYVHTRTPNIMCYLKTKDR